MRPVYTTTFLIPPPKMDPRRQTACPPCTDSSPQGPAHGDLRKLPREHVILNPLHELDPEAGVPHRAGLSPGLGQSGSELLPGQAPALPSRRVGTTISSGDPRSPRQPAVHWTQAHGGQGGGVSLTTHMHRMSARLGSPPVAGVSVLG